MHLDVYTEQCNPRGLHAWLLSFISVELFSCFALSNRSAKLLLRVGRKQPDLASFDALGPLVTLALWRSCGVLNGSAAVDEFCVEIQSLSCKSARKSS